MKIAIINYSDIQGGAARAAYRLHRGLLDHDIDSRMFVLEKQSHDNTVIAPKNSVLVSKIRKRIDQFPLKMYKDRSSTYFTINWLPFSPIIKRVLKFEPDLVHLHWIGAGTLNLRDLLKFKSPIVWSLHDMYAFTGGCHLDNYCGNYEKECGECPLLGSNKKKDLSFFIHKRKERIYSDTGNLNIVGLSQWITKHAEKSSLRTSFNQVINIPNPINVNRFKPINRDSARQILGFPKEKKLILFGAVSALTNRMKGFTKLQRTVQDLGRKDSELIIFGAEKPEDSLDLPLPVRYLGVLKDDLSLQVLYSAVDVMVVPSLQENLSNIIMESLSCGTPVVAFKVGGNADLIDNRENGYLAEPHSSEDLSKGINWVLDHPDPSLLKLNARNKVIKNFEAKHVIEQYLDLYLQLVSDND